MDGERSKDLRRTAYTRAGSSTTGWNVWRDVSRDPLLTLLNALVIVFLMWVLSEVLSEEPFYTRAP